MAKRRRKGRPVNGVLLLDKPAGLTSNQALQNVKHIYKAAKAGHTGSLDPLATGMLPLCFGEATKISAFLLDADKRYQMTVQLGVTTTTGDAEGEVLQQRDACAVTLTQIETALQDFQGEIEQIPPMYSALKHNGQRLYKLAREGIEVERKPRTITIYSTEVEDYDDGVLNMQVHCSKGTYVRTLAEDLGEKLGCGAHVTQLRRTAVGPYQGGMISLAELEAMADAPFAELDALLLPIESGVANWPDIRLDANAAFYMSQGQPIQVPHAPTEGWVRLYDQQRFLGVGEIQDDGRVAPRRMIAASAV